MRVKATLGLYLKDRPEDFFGKSSESWTIEGGSEELTINHLLLSVIHCSAEFFGSCYTAEELNAQMELFKGAIEQAIFTEEK